MEDSSDDVVEVDSAKVAEMIESESEISVKQNKEKGKYQSGKRKKSSDCWNHFTSIDGDDLHMKCNYCSAKISAGSGNGTQARNRHTTRCKKAPFNLDKKQTILDFESKTKVNNDGSIEMVSVPKLWRFDQMALRKAAAVMCILDELPFCFVERQGFREFCKIAIPDFVPPSRTTLTRDCYAIFVEKRDVLKNFFEKLSSRVCLTTDTWTSGQNLSYMCLTAHFIDDDWKLHKKIINFCPVGGHSGELIGKSVEKCLQEWGLKNILTVTVDNASSNDLAIQYLKKVFNLWDGCVLNADFLHMRCAAHILNLVVKDGLKDVDVAITKVRAAVKYVRSSPARLEKFKSCVREENVTSKGLVSLDIETRWNSTFLMLKSALVFRKAFKNLKTKYPPYTKELRKIGGAPDDDEWDRIACFLPFLEVFYLSTLKLSGSRYVTGNALVQDIYDIGYQISENINSEDVGLARMARQMKLKFDKYWSNVNNINVLMFIAMVLDPRHKLDYVKYIISSSYNEIDSPILCLRVKTVLESLFDFYASSEPPKEVGMSSVQASSSQIEEGGIGGMGLKRKSLRDDYKRESVSVDRSRSKNELEKYLLDEEVSDDDVGFDILDWWSSQKKNYPILMKMARDVLAIPVSTVASESAFSTGGRVLDSFRTSLTPRMVEALICAQDWLRNPRQPFLIIEESLLEMEKMEEEEGMKDLISKQPIITIDETPDIWDFTCEV